MLLHTRWVKRNAGHGTPAGIRFNLQSLGEPTETDLESSCTVLADIRWTLDSGGIGRRLIAYGGIRLNNNLACNPVVDVDGWMQYAELCWVQIPTYPIVPQKSNTVMVS